MRAPTLSSLAAVFSLVLLCPGLSLGDDVWSPAPDDDGGVGPLLASLGNDLDTYRTLLLNTFSNETSGNKYNSNIGQYRNILLPNINEIFPNMSSPECVGCQVAFTFLRGALRTLKRQCSDLLPILLVVCKQLMKSQGKDGNIICPGVLENYCPYVREIIIRSGKRMTVVDSCVFFNWCPAPEFDDDVNPIQYSAYYTEPQDANTDRIFGDTDGDGNTQLYIDEQPFRVVQLADPHVDPKYAVGSAVRCSLPVCCSSDYNGTGAARAYGEYTCNVPQSTVVKFLEKAKMLEPDLVLYTGDSPPHHLWYETQESQTASTTWLAQQMHRLIPGVPILPAVGNHDVYPSNMYYVPNASTKELHDALIDKYAAWFNAENEKTIRAGGYYVKEITKKLRVLAYNSNFGYTDNWFNMVSQFEPEYLEMKHFVEKELMVARMAGAKVILSGHHPMGYNIIEFDEWMSHTVIAFRDVIVLHVTGHKHTDEVHLVKGPSSQWAGHVQFAAPSSTSIRSINPSLRVYELHPKTYKLLDFVQYHMDLSVQTTDEPPIVELYRATQEYGLPDLSPPSWHKLALQMLNDTALLNRYQDNFGTRTPERNTRCNETDIKCHNDRVCRIVGSTVTQTMRCRKNGVPIPTGALPSEASPSSGNTSHLNYTILIGAIGMALLQILYNAIWVCFNPFPL